MLFYIRNMSIKNISIVLLDKAHYYFSYHSNSNSG